MKKIFVVGALVLSGASLQQLQAVDVNYYATLNGLKGEALKTAVHSLCRIHFVLPGSSTTSVYNNLSTTFAETDCRTIDGVDYWWDMYSTALNPMTMTFSECSYQREHALPKSWWKDESLAESKNVSYTTAYCDMHHLYPSNGSANMSKSNWPLGIVSNATTDNGAVKIGTPADGFIYGIESAPSKVFEPGDEYKGDFARAYMYVVTVYQDLVWADDCLWMVQNDTWSTFTDWARDLLGSWHRADNVSLKETSRNDAVESIQGNRNPYIDLPNLYEYVWGDSVGTALPLATTLKSDGVTGTFVDDPDTPIVADCIFYQADCTGGDTGDCVIENEWDPGFDVWTNDTSYGWKASGYRGSAKSTSSRLLTPEIDLTHAEEAIFTYRQAINYTDASPMHVYVRKSSGEEVDISNLITWPETQSWKFVESGNCDLSQFLGDKIRIVFHYTSTTSAAGTWEVKNIEVRGSARMSGCSSPQTADETPARYYSIDGRPVSPSSYRGVALRCQGTNVTKVLLR